MSEDANDKPQEELSAEEAQQVIEAIAQIEKQEADQDATDSTKP